MQDNDKTIRLMRRYVRRPSTYSLLRPLLELGMVGENPGFKVWVRFLLDISRRAYLRKRPVVWMNAFAPVELAYGLNMVPFMPEIIACMAAYLGWSRRPIALADTHISTDLCSFYRCALGLALEGFLPRPDLIITSSHLCDGANKFFNYLSRVMDCPHLMLDPPYTESDAGRRYLASQLEEVSGETCEALGISYHPGTMSHALSLSNQARGYMERINLLRRVRPTPLSGAEGLSYLAGMSFFSLGSDWGVLFYRSLYHYLRKLVSKGKGYLPEEKYRLLWLHHIRPYYKNEIFQILAQHHASVPFEEAGYLYWPPLRPEAPWKSLASKMLSSVWGGPLERRMKAIWNMVEDYHIDGVIHFSHWGCRQSCGGAAIIGDLLKQKGLPYIILPGDGGDSDNYSPSQTRTRLEALVEMLG